MPSAPRTLPPLTASVRRCAPPGSSPTWCALLLPRRHGQPVASTGPAHARAAPAACFRTQSRQTRRGGRARPPSRRRVAVNLLAISLRAATGPRHGSSGTMNVTILRDVVTMRRGGMNGARSHRGKGAGARAHARRIEKLGGGATVHVLQSGIQADGATTTKNGGWAAAWHAVYLVAASCPFFIFDFSVRTLASRIPRYGGVVRGLKVTVNAGRDE